MRRSLLAPWLCLPAACAAAPYEEGAGAAAFVEEHYRRIGVGADWAAVRADFWAEARIARARPETPGVLESVPVAQYFAGAAAGIDALAGFSITPLGLRVTVYDRVATVWAHVRVTSVAADGSTSEFAAADVFSLARDGRDAWKIHGLLWQSAHPDWPPARDRSAQPFTDRGMEVRLGFGYSRP